MKNQESGQWSERKWSVVSGQKSTDHCSLTTDHLFTAACCIMICLLYFAGCAPKEKPVHPLVRLSVAEYPEFYDDIAYSGLEFGVMQSISYLKRLPPDRMFLFGEDSYSADHMIQTMEDFLFFIQEKPSADEINQYIKSKYLVYRSVGRDGKGEVLFTGYYEPFLNGSKEQTEIYKFPIYSRPDDLAVVDLSQFSPKFKGETIIGRVEGKTFVPYYERSEIDKGILEGKADVLAWVDNKVDLFFLHIQGSGKIAFEDGETINVHYNTKNGRIYRSIGTLLIETGKILKDEMSMQKIREYIDANPEEMDDILNYNASYIFFNIEEDGPLGALNLKLAPGRSIALDKQIFPKSAIAFIETKKPLIDGSGNIHEWTDCLRFVLNHDTGGAIVGPGRADIFWGNGQYAEIAAGHMKHKGSLYFLVLKSE